MKTITMLRRRIDPFSEPGSVRLDTARIVKRDGNRYVMVTGDASPATGAKAAGCLLEPEEGDIVLMARDAPEGTFILTVLQRGDSRARIVFEGDTSITAEGGELTFQAQNVEIRGERAASIEAPEVTVKGAHGRVSFFSLAMAVNYASGRFTKLAAVAEKLDTVADRVTQRVRDCFRWVERLDQTRAEQIDMKASGRFGVKAGQAALVAEQDVKIDGDKIRLG